TAESREPQRPQERQRRPTQKQNRRCTAHDRLSIHSFRPPTRMSDECSRFAKRLPVLDAMELARSNRFRIVNRKQFYFYPSRRSYDMSNTRVCAFLERGRSRAKRCSKNNSGAAKPSDQCRIATTDITWSLPT